MRILIVGSLRSPYCVEIQQAAQKRAVECDIIPFERLASHISCGSEKILAPNESVRCSSINEYDVCLVRNMPSGSLEQIIFRMDLLWSLEASGVHVLNPPKAIECAVDKYLTLSRCQLKGIPVPETYCCESAEQALSAFEMLGRDAVLKPIFGAEGEGIIRLCQLDAARKEFQQWQQRGAIFYLQKYIDSQEKLRSDLRLLVLGGTVLGAIQRTSENDFRTNCSLAGQASSYIPNEKEVELAKRACDATGVQFGGVDLIYDSKGNLYLLEVNACPGWEAFCEVTGIDVPGELINWVIEQHQ